MFDTGTNLLTETASVAHCLAGQDVAVRFFLVMTTAYRYNFTDYCDNSTPM